MISDRRRIDFAARGASLKTSFPSVKPPLRRRYDIVTRSRDTLKQHGLWEARRRCLPRGEAAGTGAIILNGGGCNRINARADDVSVFVAGADLCADTRFICKTALCKLIRPRSLLAGPRISRVRRRTSHRGAQGGAKPIYCVRGKSDWTHCFNVRIMFTRG